MNFTVVVPARLAATRLPGKSLADICGKPMIVHVLERARQTGAARVIAAIDSASIAAAVTAAGFEVAMTGECATGTERVAQAARQLGIDGVIVNLQGDEPEVDPDLVRAVAQRAATGDCACATAAAPITTATAADPHVVKVVVTASGQAALFSRAPIPHCQPPAQAEYLGHMGIYAFAPGRLERTLALKTCELETVERLEQLRWLWHDWPIAVIRASSFSRGIDTEADLAAARQRLQANGGRP